MHVVKIDPKLPEEDLLVQIARILQEGGVVAYPTETFYGLAADAANEAAVARVFAIKGRPTAKPLPLIIGTNDDLAWAAAATCVAARLLIAAFWPGPLTLVLPARPHVSPLLTAGSGKIGIRLSSHPIAAGLARILGRPITATSANRSGHTAHTCPQKLATALATELDLVIDGGQAPGGKGSTIVDVSLTPPAIIRDGAIPGDAVRRALADTARIPPFTAGGARQRS